MSIFRKTRQRGMATLLMAVVLLVVVTLSTIYLSRATIFDLKSSGNQYRQNQAFEMGQRGVEMGVAWLVARVAVEDSKPEDAWDCAAKKPVPYIRAVWADLPGEDPDYEYLDLTNECNSDAPNAASIAPQLGDAAYNVDLKYRRLKGVLAEKYRVEVVAVAKTVGYDGSQDPYKAQTYVVQALSLRQNIGGAYPNNPNAPILVGKGISNVTGTPDICPDSPSNVEINQGNREDCTAGDEDTPGTAIATLQPTTIGFINPGHFETHGGTIEALGKNPGDPGYDPDVTPRVHDVMFPGQTENDIRLLSEYQYNALPVARRTVFYYGAGSSYGSPPNKISALGSSSSPVLVYVGSSAYSGTDCPGFGPGQYFGVFYMGGDCSGQGWGNADIYGTLAIEGSLTKFSANTINRFSNIDPFVGVPGGDATSYTAKVPGGWRDFKHQGE